MISNRGYLINWLALGLLTLGIIGSLGVGYVEYVEKNNSNDSESKLPPSIINEESVSLIDNEVLIENNQKNIAVDNVKAINNTTKSIELNSTTLTLSGNNLWPIFDLYNKSFLDNDLNLHNKVSYRKVSVDEWSDANSDKLNKLVYDTNMKLNKLDFVNKVYDDKQAIYSTEYNKVDYQNGLSYYEAHSILFIKDQMGNWVILGQGNTNKGSADKSPEGEAELKSWLVDSDKDGIVDVDENCSKAEKYNLKNCVKTDPNKKDTNGDGWWDGIEVGF